MPSCVYFMHVNFAQPSRKTYPFHVSEVVLIFDLDGTLYDAGNGYVNRIRSNLFEFMYYKVIEEQYHHKYLICLGSYH